MADGSNQGNNGKGNCLERDEWQTPHKLFTDLTQQYDNAITSQKQKMEADANNMSIVQPILEFFGQFQYSDFFLNPMEANLHFDNGYEIWH